MMISMIGGTGLMAVYNMPIIINNFKNNIIILIGGFCLNTIENNPFIKRLNNGVNTSFMLMAHNAYWSQFTILERKYDNFHAYISGSGTAYTRLRKEDIPKNCDFILLDGSDYFSKDEMDKTKTMAQKISEENNKRVTIGYVYFIPKEQRIDPNIFSEIKIISLKNNVEDEETISIDGIHNLIFLAGIIVEKHIELENQKVLKKM